VAPEFSDRDVERRAAVSDGEDPPGNLVVSWSVDGEVATDPLRGNVNGVATTTIDLDVGERLLEATVWDPEGLSSRASVTVRVRPPNIQPTCGITEPDDGVGASTAAPVLLRGFATDDDDPREALTVAWSSDLQGTLGSDAPGVNGEVRQVTGALDAGWHTILLQVDDGVGGLCEDDITLGVSTRPEVDMELPFNGAIFEDDDPILLAGIASDPEDGAAGLHVDWLSDQDGELGSSTTDDDGYAEFVVPALTVGLHRLRMQVTDSFGVGGSAEVDVTIIPAAVR